jgi:hypothetical protein
MRHSWLKDDSGRMKLTALVLVALVGSLASAAAADAVYPPSPPPALVEAPRPHAEATRRSEPQHVRTCFNSAETREKIASRRLSEPFRLLRGAAGRVQGEALRAKLCRWNDEYVYEIALLRRDGRIVHVYLNATSGQSVGAFNEH